MTKKNKILIIVLVLIITFSITGFATFSRYIKDSLYNYYLESHGFYFASEELGNNKVNTNMLWDGNQVYFSINNFINKSSITDYDIDYTVSCNVVDNHDLICSLNGENKSMISAKLNHDEHCIDEVNEHNVASYDKDSCTTNNYTWKNHQVSDQVYFEVTDKFDNPISDVTVSITVSSTAPYQKELTGTFKLHKVPVSNQEITYEVRNQELYHELVITNHSNENKCVLVTFDSTTRTLSDDTTLTNIEIDNNGYINGFKTTINSLNNKKIALYGKTTLNNDFTDITVSESNGC